jgi:hypothetical protein
MLNASMASSKEHGVPPLGMSKDQLLSLIFTVIDVAQGGEAF